MPSNEESIVAIENASTAMVEVGTKFVKKNPIKVSFYIIGCLICFLFTGFAVSQQQEINYHNEMQAIDYEGLQNAYDQHKYYAEMYRRSRGWFYTCDERCQPLKKKHDEWKSLYQEEQKKVDLDFKLARSHVGIFSKYGVEEARQNFASQFARGNEFAKRRSMWDAMFQGMRAMTRDETMSEYLFRLLLHVVMNFTLGLIGTVFGFMFSLWGLITSFGASYPEAFAFFFLGALAAISFALSFFVGFYAVASGVAYVGLKTVASNMRIANNRGAHQGYIPNRPHNNRAHYD